MISSRRNHYRSEAKNNPSSPRLLRTGRRTSHVQKEANNPLAGRTGWDFNIIKETSAKPGPKKKKTSSSPKPQKKEVTNGPARKKEKSNQDQTEKAFAPSKRKKKKRIKKSPKTTSRTKKHGEKSKALEQVKSFHNVFDIFTKTRNQSILQLAIKKLQELKERPQSIFNEKIRNKDYNEIIQELFEAISEVEYPHELYLKSEVNHKFFEIFNNRLPNLFYWKWHFLFMLHSLKYPHAFENLEPALFIKKPFECTKDYLHDFVYDQSIVIYTDKFFTEITSTFRGIINNKGDRFRLRITGDTQQTMDEKQQISTGLLEIIPVSFLDLINVLGTIAPLKHFMGTFKNFFVRSKGKIGFNYLDTLCKNFTAIEEDYAALIEKLEEINILLNKKIPVSSNALEQTTKILKEEERKQQETFRHLNMKRFIINEFSNETEKIKRKENEETMRLQREESNQHLKELLEKEEVKTLDLLKEVASN